MPTPSSSSATRSDLLRLEAKVDQLLADHVKQADLDKLEARLSDQLNRQAASTYNREYVDAIKEEVKELKLRVASQWEQTLTRIGIITSIIYVLVQILHIHLS